MSTVIAIAALLAGTPAPLPSADEMAATLGRDFEAVQLRTTPGQICRDRIHKVREEMGLPALNRETASPDEAHLIAAVDYRLEGCSVMVMRNDTSDIRPLPATDPNPSLRPAQ